MIAIVLVLSAAYSGSLTAVFAAPAYEKQINSLEDVVRAGREHGIVPGWPPQSGIDTLIMASI